MSNNQYVYAVARIRSKELSLLNDQAIGQLLGAKDYSECLRMLADRGWGNGESNLSAETMLADEREKTWALIGELVDDLSPFDVFLYANDYHNLKAAIKLVCTGDQDFGVFLHNGTLDPQEIRRLVEAQAFAELPEQMRAPAEEAYTALAQTGDGQLCDIILDRAALEAVLQAGQASKSPLFALYAELTAASANIKTAVRCQRTGKSMEFIRRALAPCGSLDVGHLAKAAAESMDAICDYLAQTDYASAVGALRQSPSAFERWCDNLMIQRIKPQQFEPFGIGPLAAYIRGRENEIKSVRIILMGKLNGLPEEAIRDRVREMYV